MMHIKCFHFNFIQVNTYVLYDETHEAVIIDPGNADETEHQELLQFIQDQTLNVKYIINTHPHIDHILGNGFCRESFHAPLVYHAAGETIYAHAVAYGTAFHLPCTQDQFPLADQHIAEGDTLHFGHQTLSFLYTPGHADGSISIVNNAECCLFVGDLLFENSIGRSDLPTGNFRLLIEQIHNKILTLPNHFTIYPGHGPSTTIEKEKNNNPYIQQRR